MTHYKFFSSLLFLILTSFSCSHKYDIKKPYLYEISKNKKVGYVLGTLDRGTLVDDFSEQFWAFFNKSDILVQESDSRLQHEYKKTSNEYQWRTLNQSPIQLLLTPDEYAILEFKVKEGMYKLGYGAEVRENFLRNASVYGVLSFLRHFNRSTVMINVSEFVREKMTFDEQIAEKSAEQNKIFDTLDPSDGRWYYDCASADEKKNLQSIRDLLKDNLKDLTIDYYRKEKEDYRNGIYVARPESARFDYKCDVVERNKNWLFKINSNMINYSSPFITVGIQHLSSLNQKDSLINLLLQDGYQVRRMSELDLPFEK